MQPIHQEIIIAPYDLILISGAMYLFCFAPSICDFPAINRVFQDLPDQRSVKQRSIAILPLYFANTMISQIEGSKMKWGRNAVDKLVFSEASYLDLANSSFSWQSANFIDCCLRNRIVFIGVSFADTNMRRWLSSIHKNKMEDLQKNGESHIDTTEHFWINKKPSSTSEMRWIEETVAHLGVRLIWIDDWKDIGLVMDTLMGIA